MNVRKPYQDNQLDEDGKMRKVWMFPVKSVSGKTTIAAPKLKAAQKKTKKKLSKMTLAELKAAAKRRSTKKPSHRRVNSEEYVRDEYIAEYTKRLANGICELCGRPAPFIDDDGEPYLESHHIVWLSKGGADSEKNTAALCPNCHRKMHIINDPADVKTLLAKAATH